MNETDSTSTGAPVPPGGVHPETDGAEAQFDFAPPARHEDPRGALTA